LDPVPFFAELSREFVPFDVDTADGLLDPFDVDTVDGLLDDA